MLSGEDTCDGRLHWQGVSAEDGNKQEEDQQELDAGEDILHTAAHSQAEQIDEIEKAYPTNGDQLAEQLRRGTCVEKTTDVFRADNAYNGSGTCVGYQYDTIHGKSQRRMIAIGEDLIIASHHRITGAYLSIGKCTAKRYHSAKGPGKEKNSRRTRPGGSYDGGTKDAHTDHQAHHDHDEVEKIQLLFTHKSYA